MGISNSQVAHLWAQQKKESAMGSNFYFVGPTIYSYGRHFPVASFQKGEDGTQAVIHNSGSYSISTSKHQGCAREAVYGLPVVEFHAPRPDMPEADENRQHFDKRVGDCLRAYAKITRGTKDQTKEERKLACLDMADQVAREQARFSDFFGLGWERIPLVRDRPDWESQLAHIEELEREKARNEREQASIRQQRAQEAAEERRAQRERDAQNAKAELAAWRRGEGPMPGFYRSGANGDYVRVFGEEVETTRGASVSVQEARAILPRLRALREDPDLLRRAGPIEVGDFSLSRILPNGTLCIGCHRIEWSEVEYLANALGVAL